MPTNHETSWGLASSAPLVAELERVSAEARSRSDELIRKGRLNPIEADYRFKLLASMLEDLRGAFTKSPSTPPDLDPAVPWEAKVKWINDELQARRTHYPDRIAKGRLTGDAAMRQIAAIEELRRLYWHKCFCWTPPEGPQRDYLRQLRSLPGDDVEGRAALREGPLGQAYRAAARAHCAAVDAELEDRQGRLVA